MHFCYKWPCTCRWAFPDIRPTTTIDFSVPWPFHHQDVHGVAAQAQMDSISEVEQEFDKAPTNHGPASSQSVAEEDEVRASEGFFP